ncbi:hypothetical protein EDB19DRAFT_1831179 [Suillus lakei]|nr:hypothetical protein EDB19DRAFT_1831179 [Suillus lakei]
MDKNSKKMLCIDKITGIFNHTEACESLVQMDRDPQIGLHPEIQTYTLSLVKLQVPITQLQQRCCEFAKDKFGDAPGNTHHRACSLLFIGMVINDTKKGILVVFFHFTARKSTTAAHMDYDGPLLQDLLGHWKQAMGKNEAGEDFDIKVVVTDNDTCE